jgi:hypothetical protein
VGTHLNRSNIFPVIRKPPEILMKERTVATAPIQCAGESGIKPLDSLFPCANSSMPPTAVIPEIAFVTIVKREVS